MRLSIVAAVGLLAIPTLAGAHAGNDDPNVVHACIANASQVVRIVGVSGSCIVSPMSKAETPAHWAIQGTQGPPGASGINGTNGTNGIDGTSVTLLGTFSGDQNGCPNGGTILGTANGNAYVCNGQTATATNPDPPCFVRVMRYVVCGNGTVTDTVTGLIWLQQADCLPINSWVDASAAVARLKDGDCNLTDKSTPGDWRLPTRDEWSATIAQAMALGCYNAAAPTLTNEPGTGCESVGPSIFVGVAADFYWSSTANASVPADAWSQNLVNGGVYGFTKHTTSLRVWPVRGGSR
jgi:hypothetical protein